MTKISITLLLSIFISCSRYSTEVISDGAFKRITKSKFYSKGGIKEELYRLMENDTLIEKGRLKYKPHTGHGEPYKGRITYYWPTKKIVRISKSY
jgi:hypothetical protein